MLRDRLPVREEFQNDPQIDPVPITRAVFDVMAAQLDAGEINKIISLLPPGYCDLWPVAIIICQPGCQAANQSLVLVNA